MSYEKIFRDMGINETNFEAFNQEIRNASQSVAQAVLSEGVGKGLQAVGSGLVATGRPMAVVLGKSLDAMGQAIEYGRLVSPNVTTGELAAAGFTFGSAAAATAALTLLAPVAAGMFLGVPIAGGAAITGSAFLGALATAYPLLAFGLVAGAALVLGVFADWLIGPLGWLSDLGDVFRGLNSPLISFPDPLTLDLDGDGIELSPLGTAGQTGASTVFFDFDGDGFKERTGWVKADDGMLAIDLNGNGLIDNGGELFGQPARDGYEVLETYDTFADGVIDAKDAAFARLRIWRDLDQNGATDAGELPLMIRRAA